MKRKYLHTLSNEELLNLHGKDFNNYKEPWWCKLKLEDGCLSLFNGKIKNRMSCISCEYCKGYNIANLIWQYEMYKFKNINFKK